MPFHFLLLGHLMVRQHQNLQYLRLLLAQLKLLLLLLHGKGLDRQKPQPNWSPMFYTKMVTSLTQKASDNRLEGSAALRAEGTYTPYETRNSEAVAPERLTLLCCYDQQNMYHQSNSVFYLILF